jgi:demethylmenaquinone methyltransferase/2-methoxy-6-polyprenyl-1,4-benzoquinol methylase
MNLPSAADKAAFVEAMFDRIAPRYDLLNRVLTFRLDQRWRRVAIARAAIAPGDVVVDLGCGTGDLSELAAARGARVVAVDFAARMLAGLRRRGIAASPLRADAARLPLRDGCADVLLSAFVLRNIVALEPALREAARVLRPGGRLVLLEVDEPRNPLLRWGHALHFRHIVPLVGSLLSDRVAYSYLPRSTVYLPAENELLDLLAGAGLRQARKVTLSGGVAQLLTAQR